MFFIYYFFFKVESFCATYNPDVYVVVYSVVDRQSFKVAEEILLYLWKSDYMATHGVILVGNKVDLERKREVSALGKNLIIKIFYIYNKYNRGH